ncbi:structural cement protein Gp24 [Gluconobacter albidus]|uniref:Phage tail protein n=1 Tax=Gluconobacter albidus TaxID=318683 RepID=A0AAW3QYC5_9PROT|nr:hypothetical protein [Gluconobacter albidus]KXV39474.1 hypothetical protein AD941_05145 [Gluconobacter albidus]GBQ90899.1 hypothetical protein AA3250_2160 [Gluconobacter albidus NBRC 3250]GLQ69372.1 hypothetical protein GCM10007866_18230 [Gluconobacter albidus]
MGFPTKINYTWGKGFPGGIASANPRRSAIPGPMGFVAGAGGVTVAAFGWVQADGVTVLNKPIASEAPTGFVLRDQTGLITPYLGESTMTLPSGFNVQLMTGGDYFAVSAATAATPEQAVYASTTDGTLQTGVAGTVPEGTVATGWIVTQGGAAGSTIIISGAVAPIAGSNE